MNRFFQGNNRGEAGEIKEDITSEERGRQKHALTRIIAGMTLGRDMSNVFSDVTRLMSSPAVEIKKLVYLYLMQYSSVLPEKAVLVAGSFVKDTQHASPLIRGLAIRTMSSIPVERMMEYLIEPLQRSLRDDTDPYVNRCAVLAVLKLHHISRTLCEENNMFPLLMELFSSGNATVVATVAAVVNELRTARGTDGSIETTPRIANTLQNALAESNEWGQIYILECLSNYIAPDRDEAEIICERVLPWLQHGNSAVVMATVKIIVNYLEQWCDPSAPGSEALKEEKIRKYSTKLAPALVSLVSSHDVEVRYVVLRNINLIVQRFPEMLSNHLRVFFIKYNDPIFVKLEKLEILTMLASKSNVEQLLSECVEYAQEVDIEFVRKSVRVIGILALKIDVAASECVQQLVTLIKTKVNYVVQEAIIVIRDIFRRYPNRYESIIAVLCENLETLDEPEAKSAMIWIVGEYSDRIENAVELLEIFTDNFEEETVTVKMSVLCAVVKLYLKRGAEAEQLLQTVLQQCTECDIPDLRDRAYLYWRLLTADAEAAAEAILSDREPISTDASTKYDRQVLSLLLRYLGSLSSVYHKPPRNLFSQEGATVRSMLGALIQNEEEDEEEEDSTAAAGAATSQQQGGGGATSTQRSKMDSELDIFDSIPTTISAAPAPAPAVVVAAPAPAPAKSSVSTIDDIFSSPAPTSHSAMMDPFAMASSSSSNTSTTQTLPTVLDASQSGGIGVKALFQRIGQDIILEMELSNISPQPASNFMFQMNKNVFGLTIRDPIQITQPLAAVNGKTTLRTYMSLTGPRVTEPNIPNAMTMQFAMKSSLGVAYFNVLLPIALVLAPSGYSQEEFMTAWPSIPASSTRSIRMQATPKLQPNRIQETLKASNIFFVGDRQGHLYFGAKTYVGPSLLLEVSQDTMTGSLQVVLKSTEVAFLCALEAALSALAI